MALYLMLFLPLPVEDAFWWGKWLSLLAIGFLVSVAVIVLWEFLTRKPTDIAPIKLLPPAERRRLWIEAGVGVALSMALFLL